MRHSENAVRHLTFSAMMTALTTICTAYLLHMHIAAFGGQGCFHLGDAVIYLGASLLPPVYACLSAALGGSLADLLCGSAIWIPFTFIIKALVALCFSAKGNKIFTHRNILALPAALLITVSGYYCAEGFIYGNWLTPVYSVIANVIQSAGSSFLYWIIAMLLDKADIKKQIRL